MTIIAAVMTVIGLASMCGLIICYIKTNKLIDIVSRLTAELSAERESNAQAHNIMCEKIDAIDDVASDSKIWLMNNRDRLAEALTKVDKHESLYDKQEEVLDEELKGQKLFNEGFANMMNYTGVIKPNE